VIRLFARGKRWFTDVVRITGVVAAIVAVSGFAVGLASPAGARPVPEPMYGVYTYHQDGAPDETWTMWPVCVQAGCMLNMSSVVSPHLGPVSDFPPSNGPAHKVDGLWTWQVTKDKGAKCSDGSWAPAKYSYAWDQDTLAGTLTVIHGDDCGLQPGMTKAPFTLTYKEPLPIPVSLDPLNQIDNLN